MHFIWLVGTGFRHECLVAPCRCGRPQFSGLLGVPVAKKIIKFTLRVERILQCHVWGWIFCDLITGSGVPWRRLGVEVGCLASGRGNRRNLLTGGGVCLWYVFRCDDPRHPFKLNSLLNGLLETAGGKVWAVPADCCCFFFILLQQGIVVVGEKTPPASLVFGPSF